LVTAERQLNRWKNFFESILNSDYEEDLEPEFGQQVIGESLLSRITIDPSSKGEVKKAILSMNVNKAPGIEGLTAEILKADIDTTVEMLHPVLIKVWESETLPEDWNTGCMIPLPKKGDISVCDNWRGITLLSVPSSILTHIIMNC
jgi:hypothetical protein